MSPAVIYAVIVISLSVDTAFTQVTETVPQACGDNEEFRTCGPNCPYRCDNLNSTVCCELRCVSGCFCRDGFVLRREGEPRRCVALDDCPKPGILEFDSTSVFVVESARIVRIAVVRKGGSAGVLRVQWRTREGSARNSTDFTPTEGTLIFPDGVTRQFIEVPIVDNNVRNPTRNFFVELFNATGGTPIVGRNARDVQLIRINIRDDDAKPGFVEMEKLAVTTSESARHVTINVVRLGGSDGQLSVRWRTIPGTALPGRDFTSSAGIIVFNDGQTRQTIIVDIVDDQRSEIAKSFTVQLFDPSSDVAGFRNLGENLVATVTIIDDDLTPGSVGMETSNITVPENISIVQVPVVRTGGSDGVLRVRFRTIDGTATAGSDYVMAMGSLIFNEGETRKNISIIILNDLIPEPTEFFLVELISPTSDVPGFINNATILTTTVTIIDDDARVGTVEMETSTLSVPENVGVANVVVVRSGGSNGILRINFATEDGTARAGTNYVASSGQLVFEEGETRKIIPITVLDNNVKEPNRDFIVRLLSSDVMTMDVLQPRNLGSLLTTRVTIVDDDSRSGFAVMATPFIRVPENIGQAIINVLRLGGSDGNLTVQWRTMDGTARSGEDFIQASGTLEFIEGETVKTIRVNIIDDNVPEMDETFLVQIFNTTEDADMATVENRRASEVTIVDNDGRRGFAVMARPFIRVPENIGQATINVLRLGGSNGNLTVQWRTMDGTARSGEDFIQASGTLEFIEGETVKTIRVNIIDDDVPEMDETFLVQIFNTTEDAGMATVDNGRATEVTIVDNDRRPGYVEMDQNSISVPEDIGSVQLTVLRLGGSDGTLRVRFRTVDGTAVSGVNYVATNGELVFLEGETRKTISVMIIDNDLKEGDKTFRVELIDMTSSTTLVGRTHQSRTVTEITIIDNDRRPGFLEVESLNIEVLESNGTVEIPVVRIGGSDGTFRVRFRTVSVSATPGEDFTPVEDELVFPEGVTRRIISIPILDNNRMQPNKSFRVVLFNPMLDGSRPGRLGPRSSVTITIKDNDRNAGTIEFLRSSVGQSEGEPKLTLVVLRRQGSDGLVTVRWRTRDRTAINGLNFNARPNIIRFPDGVTRQTIEIDIIDNAIKEENKIFEVELFEPTGGSVLGLNSMITVTILDNDDDSCRIQFRRRSSSIRESAGRTRIAFTRRCQDTSGTVSVFFSTVDRSAKAGIDYEAAIGILTFGPGQTESFIVVRIIDDSLEETNELFNIVLSEPSRGAVIGTPGVHTVQIIDDDDEPQTVLFSFRVTSLRVNENVGVVRVTVRRSGGTGLATVVLRTIDGSARAGTDFQPTLTTLTFERGVNERTVEVVVINDPFREAEETFTIELSSPSSGASILPGLGLVTVTIVDDDGAYLAGRGAGRDEIEEEVPPVPEVSEDIRMSCPDGLELRTCEKSCPKTCDNMLIQRPCGHTGCVRGCHCPEGLVLEQRNSTRCISTDECPDSCPGNMIRVACKLACLPSCQSPSCPRQTSLLGIGCDPGCACPFPLVLESLESTNCIDLSLCVRVSVSLSGIL